MVAQRITSTRIFDNRAPQGDDSYLCRAHHHRIIPAIPAISAGAGGAFLASGTAHAIGSIAIGVGSLLKAVSESQQPPTPPTKS